MFAAIKRFLFEETHVLTPLTNHQAWCVQHDAIERIDFVEIPEQDGSPDLAADQRIDQDFEALSQFYTPKELKNDALSTSSSLIETREVTHIMHKPPKKPTLPELPIIPPIPPIPAMRPSTTIHNTAELSSKKQLKIINQRIKLRKALHKKIQADLTVMDLDNHFDPVSIKQSQRDMHQKIKAFDEAQGVDQFAPALYQQNLQFLQEVSAQLSGDLKNTPVQSDEATPDLPITANDLNRINALIDEVNQRINEYVEQDPSPSAPNVEDHAESDVIVSKGEPAQKKAAVRAHQKSNAHTQAHTEAAKNIDDYFTDFIGLESVRSEVKKIIAFLQVQKMREAQGYAMKSPPSRHMVFTGNPGTGKTEMARLIAKIMYDTGIVAQDIFIEADRSDLIAEYLGQTAVKTKALIEQSFGGVLFIDEAYTLKTRDDDMYGDEAIATLLKMMEDHRDKVTVIVAGYEDEMQSFIESNPGLKSRFNRYIDFPDYEDEELFEILLKMFKSNHYRIANLSQIKPIAMSHLDQQRHVLGDTFANARTVRNYFEKVIEQQSLRVVQTPDADLNLVTATDFYL